MLIIGRAITFYDRDDYYRVDVWFGRIFTFDLNASTQRRTQPSKKGVPSF